MNLTNKTCLITGASRGIGKEAALGMARRGARVIMVSRSVERGVGALQEIQDQSGNPDLHFLPCDLSSQKDIRRLAQEVNTHFEQLHFLIHVAGVMLPERQLSADGYEKTFAVNYLGNFLLTNLLLEKIVHSAPARIVNTTSVGHWWGRIDFEDLQSQKHYSMFQTYGNTKLALVLYTRELARRLQGTQVSVNCVHPGLVVTDMVKGLMDSPCAHELCDRLLLTPEQGADTILYLARTDKLNGSKGEYYVKRKIARSSKTSKDMQLASKLWEKSIELTGLKDDFVIN